MADEQKAQADAMNNCTTKCNEIETGPNPQVEAIPKASPTKARKCLRYKQRSTSKTNNSGHEATHKHSEDKTRRNETPAKKTISNVAFTRIENQKRKQIYMNTSHQCPDEPVPHYIAHQNATQMAQRTK